jgi:two-component sensor histidine kinase
MPEHASVHRTALAEWNRMRSGPTGTVTDIDLPTNALTAADRLRALRQSDLMDTAPEIEFDRVTRVASRLLNTKVALLSLVDAERQFFKSALGLPEPWAAARQTPLSHSFCKHVVMTGQPLAIQDARNDALVAHNHAVSDIGVIAYLGVPVRGPDGQVLGSFCAISSTSRAWSTEDLALMQDLAGIVENEIRLREVARGANESAKENSVLAQEFYHRVKNALSVASALVVLSGKEAASVPDVVSMAKARLQALGAAHDALEIYSDGVDLKTLAERLLRAYPTRNEYVSLIGPAVFLGPAQVTPICYFLHELATNSVKYGALREGTEVAVSWRQDGQVVTLIWSEATQLLVDDKTSEPGFGSLLMQIVSNQLGGNISVERHEGRLVVTLSFEVSP